MRKFTLLLAMLMLFSVLAISQTRTVTGTVRDNQGNPIPFATICRNWNKQSSNCRRQWKLYHYGSQHANFLVSATRLHH